MLLQHFLKLVLALASIALVNCGGVDSGGTGGSAVIGPINGLGSIIVNGIRYDESFASISDDDGQPLARERLRLGMMVSIEGTPTISTTTERLATASTVHVASEVVGPVDLIDRSARTMQVLGQLVRITPATVFDDALVMGLDSVPSGATVEVFARYEKVSSSYAATRVELKANPAAFSIRGTIGAVDAASSKFSIGALTIDYSRIPAPELTNVAVGNTVKVRLDPASPPGLGRALSVAGGRRGIADGAEAIVEGRISTFESALRFSVDGVQVDASSAQFPDGISAVTLGARVQVEGTSRGGVLTARLVSVEGDEDASNSVFELHGTIESVDTVAKVLRLRGIAVDFSGSVQFVSGTIADLAVGRDIEVKGVLQPSGIGMVAQELRFEGG